MNPVLVLSLNDYWVMKSDFHFVRRGSLGYARTDGEGYTLFTEYTLSAPCMTGKYASFTVNHISPHWMKITVTNLVCHYVSMCVPVLQSVKKCKQIHVWSTVWRNKHTRIIIDQAKMIK